MEKYKR